MPLLQAESDRRYRGLGGPRWASRPPPVPPHSRLSLPLSRRTLRLLRQNLDEEAKIMKDVPGWKVCV